jgi:hypothetical protein
MGQQKWKKKAFSPKFLKNYRNKLEVFFTENQNSWENSMTKRFNLHLFLYQKKNFPQKNFF